MKVEIKGDSLSIVMENNKNITIKDGAIITQPLKNLSNSVDIINRSRAKNIIINSSPTLNRKWNKNREGASAIEY